MREQLKQRWHAIYYQTATDWSEFFSAALALILAFAYLINADRVFATAPRVYAPMRWLMPARFWGALFLFVGSLQLWAVLRTSIKWRIRAAFISTTLWLFIAILFTLGDIRALGLWLYSLHAFATARVYLSLSRARDHTQSKGTT